MWLKFPASNLLQPQTTMTAIALLLILAVCAKFGRIMIAT
jgi:hypothetical protein